MPYNQTIRIQNLIQSLPGPILIELVMDIMLPPIYKVFLKIFPAPAGQQSKFFNALDAFYFFGNGIA